MKQIFVIKIFLVLFYSQAQASLKSVGFSFVQNYTKDVYKGGTQVWSIAQDQSGIMYFGNNDGLLTFDGNNWRIHPISNRSIIRSVHTASDGRIFIGGSNEFGYFKPDDYGRLIYTSLLQLVDDKNRDFGEVWRIIPFEDGYIFQAFNAMFLYRQNKIETLSYYRNFHFSFNVDGELYIREIGKGLFKLSGKSFVPVPHTNMFGSITVMGILRYDSGTILVATREQGIFLVGEDYIRPFAPALNQFFEENQIFSALKIADDYLAFGTVQNGIVILDSKGNIVQHINRDRGLQNNTVLSLFFDSQKNLWLGLDNGIDYIHLNSPLSYLAQQNEVGAVYVIEKQDNDLYIASNQGLFTAKWLPTQQFENNRKFEFIDGSQGQVWILYNSHNTLFAGHDKGTYIVNGKSLKQISDHQGGWSFSEIPDKPGYLIEGTYSGLLLYKYDNSLSDEWKFVKRIKGFSQSCKQIQFDEEGYLWVGHGYKGVFRLRFDASMDSTDEVLHFTEKSGLPTTFNLNVLKFYNQILISSEYGIFTFDKSNYTFRYEKALTELFNNKNISCLLEDKNGDSWYFSENVMGILKPNFDGTYSRIYLPFLPIREKLITSYENVYTLDKSNILISTDAGIIHFDPTYLKTYNDVFNIRISRVEMTDSLLFDGYVEKQASEEVPSISYKNNRIRFSYAAQFYEEPEEIEYKYLLEGYDENWSEWTLLNEKEYTNLHEGSYIFHVKAKNVYGTESESQSYSFKVIPPWYRSTLAYIIYLILGLSAIVLSVILVFRKIEKEKMMLHEKQKATLREKEKAHAEAVMRAEQEIITLRNEKLEAENQKNLTELESKSKELASIAMQISYKNELLNQIKQKLIHVSGNMLHQESKQQVNKLIKTLEKDLLDREDWEKFEMHFDQVHEDFLKKLRKNFNQLTPRDLRLCSYLKMNLSSKEIAPILNITVRGVEISRYRLRKKMNLPHDENLTEYLMNL